VNSRWAHSSRQVVPVPIIHRHSVHVCTHTLTRTETDLPACAHTDTRRDTHTRSTDTPARTHCRHSCVHTRIHTDTHTDMLACTYTHTGTQDVCPHSTAQGRRLSRGQGEGRLFGPLLMVSCDSRPLCTTKATAATICREPRDAQAWTGPPNTSLSVQAGRQRLSESKEL
jgi:hypothetical protein